MIRSSFVATTCDYFLITYDGIKLLFRDQIYEIYEESVKARAGIVPAAEKIIAKEVPILSATMKKFDA